MRYLYKAKVFYVEGNKIRTVRQDGWPTGSQALDELAWDIRLKIYILGVGHLQFFTLANGFLDRPISHTMADFEVAGRPIILPLLSDFTLGHSQRHLAFSQGQSWYPVAGLPASQAKWMVQSEKNQRPIAPLGMSTTL